MNLRVGAYGQRFLHYTLAITFVIGLIAYVAGYLLRSTATTEPLGLLADLTYTFGFARWTAALIVVLLEVIPEAKRRQVRRARGVRGDAKEEGAKTGQMATSSGRDRVRHLGAGRVPAGLRPSESRLDRGPRR